MVLDGMNKLRLFFLADRVNHSSYKAAYWEKLTQHPTFSMIDTLFQEGSLSLSDYAKNSL